MTGTTRYILRQLLVVVVFVTVTLTFAVWLAQSLRFVDMIVNRGLSVVTFVTFVVTLLPMFLTIIVPIAVFIAVAFVYNKMIADSELVVMRSVGCSQARLARPAIILALLAMAAMYASTLYFLPASYRAFKDMQAEFREELASVVLQPGVFNTVFNGVTVYVRERSGEGELAGIFVHDARDPANVFTATAERGRLAFTDKGPRVIMINGARQAIDQDTQTLTQLAFDSYTMDLGALNETLKNRFREPRERFLDELFWPPDTEANRVYHDHFLAEGHSRLATPLHALTLTLIGLAALLGGAFNRRGQGWRLFAAALAVTLVELGGVGVQSLAQRNSLFIPAIYATAVAPALAALYILRGGRWPRRGRAARPAVA